MHDSYPYFYPNATANNTTYIYPSSIQITTGSTTIPFPLTQINTLPQYYTKEQMKEMIKECIGEMLFALVREEPIESTTPSPVVWETR